MHIALTGNSNAGKTCYFGALHAKYQRYRVSRLIENYDDIHNLITQGLLEQVLFSINRYVHESDRSKLDVIGDILSRRPIEFPDKTDFSDHFPMSFSFARFDLNSGDKISERQKNIAIVDVPGESFRSDNDDDLAKSDIKKVSQCDALIVFVDSDDIIVSNNDNNFYKFESNSLSAVKDILFEIIQTASRRMTSGKRILPVSVVLTKFDKFLYDPKIETDALNDLHDIIFHEIVTYISQIDARIIAMYCPISIISKQGILDPWCCEYPFLFSSLGKIINDEEQSLQVAAGHNAQQQRYEREVIAAQEAWDDAWWKRLWKLATTDEPSSWTLENQAKNAGSAADHERTEAEQDHLLKKAIISSMSIDHAQNRAPLRFAQSGDRLSLRQIKGFFG